MTESTPPDSQPKEPPVAKAAPKEDEATVRVRVTGPVTFTEFTSPATEDGPGITVTAAGVDVPESKVDELVASGAQYGVHLTADYPIVEG